MSNPVPRVLKVACVLTLTALALIAWAILRPVPLAVIAAMSVAQMLGTLGALLFVLVVLRDVRRAFRDASRWSGKGTDSEKP